MNVITLGHTFLTCFDTIFKQQSHNSWWVHFHGYKNNPITLISQNSNLSLPNSTYLRIYAACCWMLLTTMSHALRSTFWSSQLYLHQARHQVLQRQWKAKYTIWNNSLIQKLCNTLQNCQNILGNAIFKHSSRESLISSAGKRALKALVKALLWFIACIPPWKTFIHF